MCDILLTRYCWSMIPPEFIWIYFLFVYSYNVLLAQLIAGTKHKFDTQKRFDISLKSKLSIYPYLWRPIVHNTFSMVHTFPPTSQRCKSHLIMLHQPHRLRFGFCFNVILQDDLQRVCYNTWKRDGIYFCRFLIFRNANTHSLFLLFILPNSLLILSFVYCKFQWTRVWFFVVIRLVSKSKFTNYGTIVGY